MAKIEQILQKKYKDKLLKLAIYKKKLTKMQEFLKSFHLSCNPKDDVSYFQCEMLYESAFNKKRLEDCFMDSFVEMQDFWTDLDYKERCHLVNVDIQRKCGDLKYFMWHDQKIYMPVFDEHFNRVYAEEIISLELKQYRLLTKEFRNIVQANQYGSLPYLTHFSSAEWLVDDEPGYCIYFAKLNRYYHIVNESCVNTLCLDPDRKDALNSEEQKILAMLFMHQDEKALGEMIVNYHCVDDRTCKKINSYLQKMSS